MLLKRYGVQVIGRLAIGLVYFIDYILLEKTEDKKEAKQCKQAPVKADEIEVYLVSKFFEYGIGGPVNQYEDEGYESRGNK